MLLKSTVVDYSSQKLKDVAMFKTYMLHACKKKISYLDGSNMQERNSQFNLLCYLIVVENGKIL